MTTEIDALRALLSAAPRPQGWAERRLRLDNVATLDPIASDVMVQGERFGEVPVEWSRTATADPSAVLIYFHGGGYCSGSIASHRGLVTAAGRAASISTLAVGYRLAPEHPFPAALDDALLTYRTLLAKGFSPRRLALGGDSAGAGLALAVMISLREANEPLPACAWLISPWTDLKMTGATLKSKDAVDPLIHEAYLQELASAYLGAAAPDAPLASPLYAELRGLPPLLIQVGSDETLLDDAVRLAGRAGAAECRVILEIWPKMIHAWPLWAARLEPGRQAIAKAADFIRTALT